LLDLNAVENIGQFKGRLALEPYLESFEDIVGHCYFAWNKLIDMPWKIISIGIKDSDRDISIDAARCPERRTRSTGSERSISF